MDVRANPVDPLLASELLAHHGFVRALARRLVRDAESADDVAQDAMARLLEVGRPTSIRPWLRTVVTNVARRFGRLERRRAEVEGAPVPGARATAPAADELAQRLELQRRLSERVLALPPAMRDVVLLHFYEGRTMAETAEQLAIPLETARTRLRRALAELRAHWNGELGGEREGLAALALLARWTPAKALVATAAVAASPVLWTGVFVMTAKAKVAAAAALLTAAAAGAFVLWPDANPPTPPRTATATTSPPFVAPEGAAAPAIPPATATADAPKRESETRATPKIATRGTLVVHVRFARDHAAAVGLTTIVRRSGGNFRVDAERARTDANGIARFTDIAAGRVYVVSDRADAGRSATVRASETTDLDLEIEAGLDLTGIVVDAQGVPVPDALIEAAPLARADVDAEIVATTDEGGGFHARDVPVDCLVGARAAGFAPSSMTFIGGVAGNEAEVRLVLGGNGGDVEGVVIGPDAEPVAGAVVIVGSGATSGICPSGNSAPPLPALVRSDAHGRFHAVGVPVGMQPVVARARSLAPYEGRCEVRSGESASLRVELTAGAIVRGVVRDGAGQFVQDAEVRVGDWNDFVQARSRTSSEGLFELAGLRDGDVEVRAEHDDVGKGSRKVRCVSGAVVACEIALSRGLELKGRVVDERHLPVANVHVVCTGEMRPPVRTDDEGRFALPNCPTSQRMTLHFSGDEIDTTWRRDLDPSSSELEVVVHRNLPATVHIIGVVVTPDGKPVANATVSAHGTTSGNSIPCWSTDTAGRFDVGPFSPGSWRLSVQRPDFPAFRSEPHELAANATWDAGTIRLLSGGWATVEVAGDRTDVRFRLLDAAESMGSELVPVADLPRLRSEALAPGDHRLLVYGGRVATQGIPFTIRAGVETPIHVRLETGVRQALEIFVAAGIETKRGVCLRLVRDGGLLLTYSLPVNDERHCTDDVWLAPGDYEAIASADGHETRIAFTVGTEEKAAVRLDVKSSE